MDDIDRAADHIERERAGQLARRKPAGPVAVGFCLWCHEDLAPGQRWCDASCTRSWEKYKEKKS